VTVSRGAPSLKPAGHDRIAHLLHRAAFHTISAVSPRLIHKYVHIPCGAGRPATLPWSLGRTPWWVIAPWWVIEGTAAVNFQKSLLSARHATVFLMLPTSEQIRALATRCEQFRDAKAPGGYPNGLALCIVDSVQSTGIRYGTTAKVVNRYRTYRTAQGGDPETDSVSDLVQTFTELAAPEAWAAKIGTDNRTSTHAGAPLKACAIYQAAQAMVRSAIETGQDLRDAAQDHVQLAGVERDWRAVPGQRSGVTWHYLQILAGIPGVKPDRMIIRFVADTLGVPRRQAAHQRKGFAFAGSPDEDGDLARGRWDQLAQSIFDTSDPSANSAMRVATVPKSYP
jgi:hypothetical protein